AEEFCRACHTATGGNPLFLRELLRALAAAEVVPSAAAASAVQDVGPAVVSRFVLHRLAALGPAATELARAVAVLGDDSEPLLAESPAEQDRGEILAELGRYEVATMQFEAAEKHLRAALASGATLATRADAASWIGRCAIVSGGRSAGSAADALLSLAGELWP